MYARSNEMSRARFALDEAVAAMDKLEDYFGTRFTLPKLGEFAKKNISNERVYSYFKRLCQS